MNSNEKQNYVDELAIQYHSDFQSLHLVYLGHGN